MLAVASPSKKQKKVLGKRSIDRDQAKEALLLASLLEKCRLSLTTAEVETLERQELAVIAVGCQLQLVNQEVDIGEEYGFSDEEQTELLDIMEDTEGSL